MSQAVSQQIESRFRESFGNSAVLYERAVGLFPSGVTHDSRFLKPFPIYVDHASGSRKTDRDGNELIDYWMGHGALLLGHSHPAVVEAAREVLSQPMPEGQCPEGWDGRAGERIAEDLAQWMGS